MGGYVLKEYDQAKRLPPGFAAVTGFCFGVIGAVMGMSQLWFIGPIGKMIGLPEHGGDVGFELAFAFAAIAYTVTRYFEKRHFKR